MPDLIAELSTAFEQTKLRSALESTFNNAMLITEGAKEPEASITEIAKHVVANFMDISKAGGTMHLDFVERINRALKETVSGYTSEESLANTSPDTIPSAWQMDLGLRRGQDALFGAGRVTRKATTTEQEIERIDKVITDRINRRKKLLTERRVAKKAKVESQASEATTPILEVTSEPSIEPAPEPTVETTESNTTASQKPARKPSTATKTNTIEAKKPATSRRTTPKKDVVSV